MTRTRIIKNIKKAEQILKNIWIDEDSLSYYANRINRLKYQLNKRDTNQRKNKKQYKKAHGHE